MTDYSKNGKAALIYRFFKGLIIVLITSLFIFPFILAVTESMFISLVITLMLEAVIVLLPLYVSYLNLQYKIGDNSLSLKDGILNISTINIPFVRITNVLLHQSLFQRIFSVGDLYIDQEDSKYIWREVDLGTANEIIHAVSSKSNIQPITAQR